MHGALKRYARVHKPVYSGFYLSAMFIHVQPGFKGSFLIWKQQNLKNLLSSPGAV
jgi:hypothetical protein